MTTVYIDVGNSQLKWQIGPDRQRSQQISQVQCCSIEQLFLKNNLYQAISQATESVICCHPHYPQYHQLKQTLQSFTTQWINTVPSSQARFALAYEDHRTYGIDRYLSLLAVCDQAPLMLVDCGSAITIDLMSHRRQHVGGWILPGIGTSRQQLGQYGLKTQPSPAVCQQLGNNTEAAIANGYHSAIVLFLRWLEENAHQYGLKRPTCLLTGGDGKRLIPDLSTHWHYRPYLVLDGLVQHHNRHKKNRDTQIPKSSSGRSQYVES